MQISQQPPKIPSIFASSAPFNNVTNPIPNTAQTGGFVSWPTGFQDINFTQQAAGGIPPWGRDFNGLFQIFSAWIQWFQAGGAPPLYDQQFANEIGGYPQGAFLQNATTVGSFWINQTDNNLSNPDQGGANWLGFPPEFHIPPAPPPIEIFPELPPPPPPTILPPQTTLINNVKLENFLTIQNFTQPGTSNGRLINIRVYNVPGNYYYLPSTAPCSAVRITMQGAGGAGGGAYSGQGNGWCAGGGGAAGGSLQWYGPTAYVAGQLLQIGSGGQGAPNTMGGFGGDTRFDAIQCVAYGGPGGYYMPESTGFTIASGNIGGNSAGGNIWNTKGASGENAIGIAPNMFHSGNGGNNSLGGGGGWRIAPQYSGSTQPDHDPNQDGYPGYDGAGGGGGASAFGHRYAARGGAGGNGWIIIEEFS